MFPRHRRRRAGLCLAVLSLVALAAGPAAADLRQDAPNEVPTDAPPDETPVPEGDETAVPEGDETPTPLPDEGSGDDPGSIPPGATPDPGAPPPVAPCPPNQVPSTDGRCFDPTVLAGILADYEAAAEEERVALDSLATQLVRLDDLRDDLAGLEDRLARAKLRLTFAAEDAAYAELRRQVSAENLADVEAALSTEQDRLREQAVETYIGGGESDLADSASFLESETLTAAGTQQVYAQAVVDDQLQTLDRIDALEIAVTALSAEVDNLTAAAALTIEDVGGLEREVANLLGRQRMLVAEAEQQAESLAADIASIQARKAQYAEELQVTAGGGGSIGDLLNAAQAGQVPPEHVADLLQPPLDPLVIASPFGMRLHPILNYYRLHAGADLDGPAGAPISAALSGTVLIASEQGGYGNTVVIDHGNGFGTVYAHMSAIAVPVGTQVTTGQVIGFVGSTGLSTGPHLHFELRIHGQPVDPVPYIDLTPGDDGAITTEADTID